MAEFGRVELEEKEAGSRKRGRPKREIDAGALRERIMLAAYKVFLEKGYAGATTELIAALAKTSKRSIYLVFSSKDEMFAAVVLAKRHLILDLPSADAGPANFRDRIAQGFRLHITGQDDLEREALLDLITREATLSPELMEYLYERGIIRTREILIDWLIAERAHGRVQFDDVQVIASILMNLIFGSLQPRRRKGPPVSKESQANHILQCLDIVLTGLATNVGQQQASISNTEHKDR